MSRRLEILLTIAATALGVAFFVSVPYWPKEWTERALPPPLELPAGLRPSVLADLKPVPTLNLSLPDDVASVAARRGINGETGLIPTAASITTFRLRATGELVSVAAPTGLDPVRRAPSEPDSSYRVHGAYAVITVERGSTILRWTENGVTYEISSRTLDAIRLVELANKLR
jgi:hypothetical protein